MPKLGLGTGIGRSGIVTPGIVTDNLVMKHMYAAGAIQPLSDGAAYFALSDSDIISVSDNDSSDIGTGDLTWTAWIWVNDVSAGNQGIISKWQQENDRYYLRVIGADGSLNFYGKSGGTAITNGYSTTGLIVDKTWVHVAAVLDSSNKVYFYINGIARGEGTGGTDDLNKDNSGDIRIGCRGFSSDTPDDPFGGYITNIGMWKRMLTQAEIKSIMWKQYADLSTTEKTSLVSFWNLDAQGLSGFDFVLDESQTLGANLWDGGDVGPDSLGDADGHPSHSMDISDAGLVDGDVIKITGTITGTDTGRVIFPDTGAGSNGIRVIPNNVYGGTDGVNANYWDTDGTKTIYCWVDPTTNGSGVSGNLKCRTSYNYNGGDDRTQKITNISVQKVTNAGRLV